METGGSRASGSGRSERAIDLVFWLLAFALMAGLAAAVAWVLSNASFTLREVPYEDDAVGAGVLVPTAPAREPVPADAASPTGAPGADDSDASGVVPAGWARQPAPYYPERAVRLGIEAGEVVLVCDAFSSGELGDCEVLRESPPRAGFADAALASMRQARVTPRTVDGMPVAGRVRFTLRFKLEP